MQQLISLFVIVSVNQVALSKPINNGFTVKLHPIFVNEDVHPKTFGALFAKNPQESTHAADIRREILSKAYFAHSPGTGCTNPIAKILSPFKGSDENSSLPPDTNYINIPIIEQPFDDYKIVVATAPFNVKIAGSEAKPLVIYVVFPQDEESDSRTHQMQVPTIYFVRKPRDMPVLKKNYKVDPVLIIDSNRTVTGLKSKEVAKFVKFRNKLINRYNYEITR